MMDVFIVDDEPLAREELAQNLAAFDDINITGEYGNGLDCLKALNQQAPDVIFLDIEMPVLSGMELAAMLPKDSAPAIVFVTAYDQFAIQAFEHNAVDYLLKPLDVNRLQQTITRLRATAKPEPVDYEKLLPESSLKLVPCYQSKSLKLMRLEDIEYAFSDMAGVHIWAGEQECHCQMTLKVLEERTDMIRCHRQYLVNPIAIQEVELTADGNAMIHTKSRQQIPVSRRHLKTIRDTFSLG